jgi:hypothetical protein
MFQNVFNFICHARTEQPPADDGMRYKLVRMHSAKLYQNGTINAVKSRDTRNLCHLRKNILHFDWGKPINQGAIRFGTIE